MWQCCVFGRLDGSYIFVLPALIFSHLVLGSKPATLEGACIRCPVRKSSSTERRSERFLMLRQRKTCSFATLSVPPAQRPPCSRRNGTPLLSLVTCCLALFREHLMTMSLWQPVDFDKLFLLYFVLSRIRSTMATEHTNTQS